MVESPTVMENALSKTIKIPEYAMCLAAGKGTRMMPLTEYTPKPCLKVGGKPIIDWVLDYLEDAGVENAVINLHHHPDIMRSYLKNRTYPKLTLLYEEILLETGGGLKNALPYLGDKAFYAMNTDVIWIENPQSNLSALQKLAEAWDEDKMDLLIMLQPKEGGYFFDLDGDYFINEDGTLRLANRETKEPAPYHFNGLRLIHPRLFDGSKDNTESWTFREVMIRAEKNGRLFGIIHDGESYHIGRPESLDKANEILGQTQPCRKKSSL